MAAARFQRGKIGGISPFFAFQDIITSAMAVLIAIIMLLALYISDTPPASVGETGTQQSEARLQTLLDELNQITGEVRLAQEAATAESRDPALLKAEVETLRHELQMFIAQNQSDEKKTGSLRDNDSSAVTRSELEKKRAIVAAAAIQLIDLEKNATRSFDDMKRVEAAAREREAQLLAEQARKNQMWLIPDLPSTSKEPVLAVVSANQLTLQRFDHPEKETLDGRKVTRGFTDILKRYSKLNQYIVFYFRPSGAEHFEALTDAAKSAGFEIGYDAIGENVEINFNSVQ